MMKLFDFRGSGDLNKVVFQNRHKNYGAYQLRAEEGNILQRALLFGISSFITVAAIPFIIAAFQPKAEKLIPFYLPPAILDDVAGQEVKKPETVKMEEHTEAKGKVLDSRIPEPSSVIEEENTVAKNADRQTSVAGFENKDGDEVISFVAPPKTGVPPSPTITKVLPTVIIDENEIRFTADVEARFPGGLNAFRNQVGKYFQADYFQGSGESFNAIVTFVVEKDGTLSSVKATGNDAAFNKEAVKTITHITGKWIPAKVKGKNVRYGFKIPVTMQFE